MQRTKFFYVLRIAKEHHLQGKEVPKKLLKAIKELEKQGIVIPYYKTPKRIPLFGEDEEPDKSY